MCEYNDLEEKMCKIGLITNKESEYILIKEIIEVKLGFTNCKYVKLDVGEDSEFVHNKDLKMIITFINQANSESISYMYLEVIPLAQRVSTPLFILAKGNLTSYLKNELNCQSVTVINIKSDLAILQENLLWV